MTASAVGAPQGARSSSGQGRVRGAYFICSVRHVHVCHVKRIACVSKVSVLFSLAHTAPCRSYTRTLKYTQTRTDSLWPLHAPYLHLTRNSPAPHHTHTSPDLHPPAPDLNLTSTSPTSHQHLSLNTPTIISPQPRSPEHLSRARLSTSPKPHPRPPARIVSRHRYCYAITTKAA